MIRNKKIREEEEVPPTKWLTTFNDMITLLMVFFVLLFSLSSIDVKKLYDAQASLRSGLGILEAGRKTAVSVIPEKEEDRPADSSLSESRDEIEDTMKALEGEPGVGSFYSENEVVIRLDDRIIYESGQDGIEPEGLPVLSRITDVLAKTKGPIRVEGHTDDVPIVHNRKFPSNWELSIARAVNVVKYFVNEGKISPERLSAVGYGESRPLVSNDSPENRARNRRVEIVLAIKEKTAHE